jgi:hypothetical protein
MGRTTSPTPCFDRRGRDVVPVRRFAIKRMELITPAQCVASIGGAEGSRKPSLGAKQSHALAVIGDHGCNVIFLSVLMTVSTNAYGETVASVAHEAYA